MMGVDKIYWFVTVGVSDHHCGHQRATPSKPKTVL